jgi:hypothetical protein
MNDPFDASKITLVTIVHEIVEPCPDIKDGSAWSYSAVSSLSLLNTKAMIQQADNELKARRSRKGFWNHHVGSK